MHEAVDHGRHGHPVSRAAGTSSASLVVTAVRIEGGPRAEVARDYGVSPRGDYELCRRFDAEGEAGLKPRSSRDRAPRGSSSRRPGK